MSDPSKVALYARISSDQEGTALGVTRQLQDCRELAARLGWAVAEEYVDNDLSAFTGKKRRPAYERMLADLVDGERDAVIVYHVDRLTRRPIELEQFLDTIATAKVRHVRFVAGADVNIGNGDGLMVLRMMAAVAANESDGKSRRVRRKLDEVAATGMPHGGARRPFGFEDDKITHRADEAEVIRTVVARFIAGESLRSLTIWMEAQGIKSVFDKPWRTSTLRDMMTSPRIAGLRAHRGEIIGPAVWKPIITVEDRHRVMAVIANRANTNRRTPRTSLLTGLLKCGRCGHTLYASRRNETSRRYVCKGEPDHQGCGRLTVVAEALEDLVQASVLYRLDTPQLADALTGRNSADQETASLSDALATDREQLDELASMYAAREIGRAEWVTARQQIDARIKDLERRLSRIIRNDALGGIVGNGVALGTQWADLNLSRQHAIVRALLDHAVIAPTERRGSTLDPSRVDLVWRL